MAEILAVVAALSFAGTYVTARLALRDSTVVTGILVGNLVAASILVLLVLADPPKKIPFEPAAWFMVAGIIGGPGLASAAILTGIRRLGPPTHGPLQGGSYGIAVTVGAGLFLGETIGPLKAVGVTAIVIGGGWLVQAQAALTEPQGSTSWVQQTLAALPSGWYLPLAAGGGLAMSDLIAKSNLKTFPHPMFAAASAVVAGTMFWAGAVVGVPFLRRSLRVGRGVWWFVVTGLLLGAAFAALNMALNRGQASTVGPIVASQPFAATLLSAIFLSRLHRVTTGMVVAGALVVAGAILVSL